MAPSANRALGCVRTGACRASDSLCSIMALSQNPPVKVGVCRGLSPRLHRDLGDSRRRTAHRRVGVPCPIRLTISDSAKTVHIEEMVISPALRQLEQLRQGDSAGWP